jgi:glyoxylase-like metal-dependent hydrolase (beta-lactamase superfamily II)
VARIAPTGRQSGDLKLHRVAPDVYLYRGFFSNSAVLVLPKTVMVVDTQITPKAGHRLREAIGKVTDKPITHVINTHYHGDHAGGNRAFPDAEIIATEETDIFIDERDGERLEYARTFGLTFQDVPAVAPPTRTFAGELVLPLHGERIHIFQAGRVETPDACVVWWPSRKVLCCGDGVATVAYPYLGVPFLDEGLKDDGEWIRFLDNMLSLGAEYVLAGHGPALVGRDRVRERMTLLRSLFKDLFDAVKQELARGTQLEQLVAAVDEKLKRYGRHRDLQQNTVSQRFAILRAYNSVHPERRGKGWWELKPTVVKLADRAQAEAAMAGLDGPALLAQVARLGKKQVPLVHAMLDLWIDAHPADAAARALLADVLFDHSARIQPVVDATEYIKLATESAHYALVADPQQPLALLGLGCIEIWSAMVLAQSMEPGIEKLTRALASPTLTTRQRRKGNFFLGKAHQYDFRDADSDKFLRLVLPGWLRWLFPLFRKKLRSIP